MSTSSNERHALPILRGVGQSFDPEWSPDGAVMVFISDVDGHNNVHSLELETGICTRLTANDADYRSPSMSPDGSSIVYLKYHWLRAPQVWMMDVDGGNARPWYSCPGYKVRPTFSPDGSWVAVQIGSTDARIHKIRSRDPADRASIDLSRNQGRDTYPSWSPDGTRLSFTRWNGSTSGRHEPVKHVWIMDSDGGNQRPLATYSITKHSCWSPDGQWIAFDAATDVGRDLFVMSPDGVALRRITSNGVSSKPSFRPLQVQPGHGSR